MIGLGILCNASHHPKEGGISRVNIGRWESLVCAHRSIGRGSLSDPDEVPAMLDPDYLVFEKVSQPISPRLWLTMQRANHTKTSPAFQKPVIAIEFPPSS